MIYFIYKTHKSTITYLWIGFQYTAVNFFFGGWDSWNNLESRRNLILAHAINNKKKRFFHFLVHAIDPEPNFGSAYFTTISSFFHVFSLKNFTYFYLGRFWSMVSSIFNKNCLYFVLRITEPHEKNVKNDKILQITCFIVQHIMHMTRDKK